MPAGEAGARPTRQLPAGAAPLDGRVMAEAQALAAQLRAACDLLKGGPRTSKEDPNFVETFFSASRLHFIGGGWGRGETPRKGWTWRSASRNLSEEKETRQSCMPVPVGDCAGSHCC